MPAKRATRPGQSTEGDSSDDEQRRRAAVAALRHAGAGVRAACPGALRRGARAERMGGRPRLRVGEPDRAPRLRRRVLPLAGRTRSLRILVAALVLPLYDPIRLAEDLAVLDLTSGGRIDLVIGAGYRR